MALFKKKFNVLLKRKKRKKWHLWYVTIILYSAWNQIPNAFVLQKTKKTSFCNQYFKVNTERICKFVRFLLIVVTFIKIYLVLQTNLKTLNTLSELYIETNNPREGLNCLTNVVKVNPLALFILRKILNYASSSIVENFVQMVCKKINEQHLPIELTVFTSLVQAFHLARLPINFKASYQTLFNLRSTQIFNSDYSSCWTVQSMTKATFTSLSEFLPIAVQ